MDYFLFNFSGVQFHYTMSLLFSEYSVKNLVSNIVFIDKSDGKALRMDASFAQMGIGDGAKLVLL